MPSIVGNSSPYSFISTAAVLAAAIKTTRGSVSGIQAFNNGANEVFLRLYDKATSPITTDTPVWRGMIPGNTAAAGFVIPFSKPLEFLLGIGIRVSAAVADNDATVLTANEVFGNVQYE